MNEVSKNNTITMFKVWQVHNTLILCFQPSIPYKKAEDAHYLAFRVDLPPKYLNASQHHEFQGRKKAK